MSHDDPYPEYFGHDKVSLFGVGDMPAAPPAPPGSTARRSGDAAVADALSKVGSTQPRPGQKPAMAPLHPVRKQALRREAEHAMFAQSMRRLARREGAPDPATHVNVAWRTMLAPAYTRLPWGVKRRIVAVTSGVRGWTSRSRG
mgnify:CR=1 FL=1